MSGWHYPYCAAFAKGVLGAVEGSSDNLDRAQCALCTRDKATCSRKLLELQTKRQTLIYTNSATTPLHTPLSKLIFSILFDENTICPSRNPFKLEVKGKHACDKGKLTFTILENVSRKSPGICFSEALLYISRPYAPCTTVSHPKETSFLNAQWPENCWRIL